MRGAGTRPNLPPLEFVLPGTTVGSKGSRRSAINVLIGLAMYAAAIMLGLRNESFRRLEATAITPLANLATGNHHAVTSETIVYFGVGTSRGFGLQITNECTSALLLIPLLIMMGSFAVFTRLGLRRQIVALLAGAVLLLAVNALRVAGIAWATWHFGYDPGYTLSHVFVGSAFSLVGFVGAMLVALWIMVRVQRGVAAAALEPGAGASGAGTGPGAHRRATLLPRLVGPGRRLGGALALMSLVLAGLGLVAASVRPATTGGTVTMVISWLAAALFAVASWQVLKLGRPARHRAEPRTAPSAEQPAQPAQPATRHREDMLAAMRPSPSRNRQERLAAWLAYLEEGSGSSRSSSGRRERSR